MKIDTIKQRILNALEGKKGIMIKARRGHRPGSYDIEVGDCDNMDMSSCKGATGFHNFDLDPCLKEIKEEMEALAE